MNTKTPIQDPISGLKRFLEMGGPKKSEIISAAKAAGVPPALIAAIANNESRLRPFSMFGPTIALNPAHFDKYLLRHKIDITPIKAQMRELAKAAADKALPLAPKGDRFNSAQRVRWVELVGMATISLNGAISSTAFGLGQMLGSNFSLFGLSSPSDLYSAVWSRQDQLEQIASFLKQPVVLDAVKRLDFEQLASKYAGPKWQTIYPNWPSTIQRYYNHYLNSGLKT